MAIEFIVPGRPVGKGRPRVTRYGTYTPEKTRKYEELVRRCWKEQSGETYSGGIALVADIRGNFPIPQSTSKKRRATMVGAPYPHKCDADNLAKSILDALNNVAFPDDSAVCILNVTKVYSEEPCVEVSIREVEV
jgi:Holliday junction resolvase RusA-like endonuclease